jgi:hypothetical protein
MDGSWRSLGVKPICTDITNKAGLVDCIPADGTYTPLMSANNFGDSYAASGVAPDNCNAVHAKPLSLLANLAAAQIFWSMLSDSTLIVGSAVVVHGLSLRKQSTLI